MHRDPELRKWNSDQFDSYRIVAHEMFPTSQSYFARLAPALGVTSADELRARVVELNQSGATGRLSGRWGLSINYLANIQHLCVLP